MSQSVAHSPNLHATKLSTISYCSRKWCWDTFDAEQCDAFRQEPGIARGFLGRSTRRRPGGGGGRGEGGEVHFGFSEMVDKRVGGKVEVCAMGLGLGEGAGELHERDACRAL